MAEAVLLLLHDDGHLGARRVDLVRVLLQPRRQPVVVGDVGVLEDGGLDFGAVHVLATTQDHVLGSVDDVHEAVVVDIDDVAGAEVAVDDRLGGGLRAVYFGSSRLNKAD